LLPATALLPISEPAPRISEIVKRVTSYRLIPSAVLQEAGTDAQMEQKTLATLRKMKEEAEERQILINSSRSAPLSVSRARNLSASGLSLVKLSGRILQCDRRLASFHSYRTDRLSKRWDRVSVP
jgi:hypothetical protein